MVSPSIEEMITPWTGEVGEALSVDSDERSASAR